MIRITLQYVWSLAESLDDLARLDHTKSKPKVEVAVDIFDAKNALQMMLANSVFAPTLRSCTQLGRDLISLLETHTTGDLKGDLEPYQIWGIKNAYSQFKIAFLAELGTLPTYFVTQKGSHDTLTLLDQPYRMFPDNLVDKAPEAMFDVAEAGKALSYELATACGYHLFRATEAVLRRYYSHVTGGAPQPKVRNIAVYVQAMRQRKCGDDKILSVVEQLSKLHRNPLIHPEVSLTLDEAIAIHGIARSAVSAMLATLPDILPTTAAPATEPPNASAPDATKARSRRKSGGS